MLEIALVIPTFNERKIETKNSAAHGFIKIECYAHYRPFGEVLYILSLSYHVVLSMKMMNMASR